MTVRLQGFKTMAETTHIEWADATANFWMGCTKLSPACDFCYAEADWDLRKHRVQWGPHGDRDRVAAGPAVCRTVQRNAASFREKHGRPPRIFINSLSDFADNHKSIQQEWRDAVWQAAQDCPDIILMILTKRPQNLGDYLPADWGRGYPNVWMGTTVENQTEAERRIPELREIPASRRFLSCEPLLGSLDLNSLGLRTICDHKDAYTEWDTNATICSDCEEETLIDWVICGGESGRNARPMHPDWARSLRDQCAAASVPFFFKQWGEWKPFIGWVDGASKYTDASGSYNADKIYKWGDKIYAVRSGKNNAGRLLDGVLHSDFPNV